MSDQHASPPPPFSTPIHFLFRQQVEATCHAAKESQMGCSPHTGGLLRQRLADQLWAGPGGCSLLAVP
jgi:hypothetical protein